MVSPEPSLEVDCIFLWQDVMAEQNVQVFPEVDISPPGSATSPSLPPPGSPTSPLDSPDEGWLQVEGFSDNDMEVDSPKRLVGSNMPLQPEVQIRFSS